MAAADSCRAQLVVALSLFSSSNCATTSVRAWCNSQSRQMLGGHPPQRPLSTWCPQNPCQVPTQVPWSRRHSVRSVRGADTILAGAAKATHHGFDSGARRAGSLGLAGRGRSRLVALLLRFPIADVPAHEELAGGENSVFQTVAQVLARTPYSIACTARHAPCQDAPVTPTSCCHFPILSNRRTKACACTKCNLPESWNHPQLVSNSHTAASAASAFAPASRLRALCRSHACRDRMRVPSLCAGRIPWRPRGAVVQRRSQ